MKRLEKRGLFMIHIAIDGPSASGKSTIAKAVAQALDITYVDTGAMYRGITLAILDKGIQPSEEVAIREYLDHIDLDFKLDEKGDRVLYVNGEDASREIRSDLVTLHVSEVSAYHFVREDLVAKQQAMAKKMSLIMDGRDIGTVVLPQAQYKVFLTASVEERAKRRYLENQSKGMTDMSLEEIEADIARRDHYDSTREHSPLKKANDAIEIDTSNLTIDEVVNKVLKLIE